jgi:hypothetical protein
LVVFVNSIFEGSSNSLKIDDQFKFFYSIIKNTILVSLGLLISGTIIYWLVALFNSLTMSSSIFSTIANIIIVLMILFLIYKALTTNSLYENSPIYKLIINTVLYIPCLVFSLFSSIFKLFGPDTNISNTPPLYYLILLSIILIYVLYYSAPGIKQWLFKYEKSQIVNMPININHKTDLAGYQSLNKSNEYNYKYAISFWLYIDTETNASYEKYTSVLTYGGKPNVLYNASLNELMITMPPELSTKKNKIFKLDDNGNVIVFTKPNILLQKWNNIILNYNGGTLDIFYNGELVKSVYGFVPHMSYDTLTIGTDKGINGQICNINYFNHELDITKIFYLYNSVKDKTPPVYIIDEITINNINGIQSDINGLYKTVPYIFMKADEIINEVANDPHSIIPNKNHSTDYLSLKWYFAQNNDSTEQTLEKKY